MKITWSGQSCFQILVSNSNFDGKQSRDGQSNIVIDPFSEIGLKMPNLGADILLVSHNHTDHNNIGAVSGNPFLIDGPGEYEVSGVFIQGINSFHDDKNGSDRGLNTIYVIEAEGVRICHLGDLGQKELKEEQFEKIGHVDILMIPVGGVYTISSLEAPKIIGQIDPKLVIPMHYELPKLNIKLDGIEKFLKAMGKGPIEPQDKLTVKISALPKEGQTEIVVLKP